MKRRAYLIDDEPLALQRLARVLVSTGRVEIVGQATDPALGLAALPGSGAEIVFLDLSMPGLDGFEVAARVPAGTMVVFTTAHDEHALRAFQTPAIDYLVKPVRDLDVLRALDKIERLRQVVAPAPAAGEPDPRIASRMGDRTQLIELARISHFIAEHKLTYAVTAERSHIVDANIAELEQRYRLAGWFRIHRATLVRVAAIVEVRRATVNGTMVRLDTGHERVVARERVAALRAELGLVTQG